MIYITGKSLTVEHFNAHSLELKKENEEVYNYLMSIHLHKWVLCFSDFTCMLYITTSPIESFNKVILQERKKSLVDLLIGIRKVCSLAILKMKRKLLMTFCNESNVFIFYSVFNDDNVEKLIILFTSYFNKTVRIIIDLYCWTVEFLVYSEIQRIN